MRGTASWMRRRVLMLAVVAIGIAAVERHRARRASGERREELHRLSRARGRPDHQDQGGQLAEIRVHGRRGRGALLGRRHARRSRSRVRSSSDTNGGDERHVEIGLKPGFSLPQGCATGRVAEWDGSKWVCGVDNDTTYSAGTGLDLSAGNQFSIDPAYRVPGKSCAQASHFLRGYEPDGGLQCAAPASSTSAGFFSRLAGVQEISGTEPSFPRTSQRATTCCSLMSSGPPRASTTTRRVNAISQATRPE